MLYLRGAEHCTAFAHSTSPERQTDNTSGFDLLPEISKNVDCGYRFGGKEPDQKDSIGLGKAKKFNESRDSATQEQWSLIFTSHKYFCKSMLLTAPK